MTKLQSLKKPRLANGLNSFIRRYKIQKDRWGRLILYKTVMRDRGSWWLYANSPTGSPIVYRDGCLVRCSTWNDSRTEVCAPGLHVGTLKFARYFATDIYGSITIQVAVRPEDVVCVPYVTEDGLYCHGKIRCKELYVVGPVDRVY